MVMHNREKTDVIAEINVTPLVDVMLVLVIIFMITAPLMTHTVKVVLPVTREVQQSGVGQKVPALDLVILKNGDLYLNDLPVSLSRLKNRLVIHANRLRRPELHIRAARNTPWQIVRKVLSEARQVGMVHVSLLTTRPEGHNQD